MINNGLNRILVHKYGGSSVSDAKKIANVAKRIARFPEVKSLSLVSGGFDLSVLIVGDNMRDLANFVAQKLAALEEVSGTATHFLLKSYKEDGEILGGEDDVHRLPIVP